MKISKSRLKAIIKEELGRSDGEFKCSELQSSWDEAYGEFQRAGGRKNADALQVWDSISTNLKKQAKQLVVSGQVGLCPLLTTDEFEMGRGELKSSGGKDVGFIPETEQLGLDLGDEPASEEGPDKYQSHYEGSKLVRGPGWEELTQKLKKVEPIFPLAAKIAKMLNSFGSYSTYKLHQLEKAVDRGDWDRLQALYDGEVEFGRKMSSGYYGKLDENMESFKSQIEHIIKEEMAEVMSKKGREATMPLGRVGYDTEEKEQEATLKAIKTMSSRQPDGAIGVNTLKAAIASGDLATMINVINNAKRYMDKLTARYGVGGTMSPVRSWRKNSSAYGTDPEYSTDDTPENIQYRTEKASEDLSRLLSLVG